MYLKTGITFMICVVMSVVFSCFSNWFQYANIDFCRKKLKIKTSYLCTIINNPTGKIYEFHSTFFIVCTVKRFQIQDHQNQVTQTQCEGEDCPVTHVPQTRILKSHISAVIYFCMANFKVSVFIQHCFSHFMCCLKTL